MKRSWLTFLFVIGVIVIFTGCDNNPFYPKAEVRLVKVTPENQSLIITADVMRDQNTGSYRIESVDYEIPEPVQFTFREMYGGRWADIQHYRIEYVSVTTNYGDTLDFGPLDGGFNLLIPPGEEATASLYTVSFDMIYNAVSSLIPFFQGLPDSLVITFQERIHFEGEDELGNRITWDVPHSTVVYYVWRIESE